ncbi:hypothetical protein HDE_12838 [Halotydeus destructor]|nr:hypothetical protein HDE_12838 [Halotydeus destructor]
MAGSRAHQFSNSDSVLSAKVGSTLNICERKFTSEPTVMEKRTKFVYYDEFELELERKPSVQGANLRRLPKWLLEFESFPKERNDNVLKTCERLPSRPLTESLTRPQWFEEMVQTRRHSEDNFNVTDHLAELNANQGQSDDDTEKSRMAPNVQTRPQQFLNSPGSDGMFSHKSHSNSSIDEAPAVEPLFVRRRPSQPAIEALEPELDFVIPELPVGRHLVIEIISNWGDDDYVGLTGIEIFEAKNGSFAPIRKVWCDDDLSQEAKVLIDGVNRTHDDDHMWLVNFTKLQPIRIHFKFDTCTTLALIRFWNYNKSRIYSYRGCRDLQMTLDGRVIFRGDIAKAYGELTGPPERFGDTILFTTDDNILEKISDNDQCFNESLARSN